MTTKDEALTEAKNIAVIECLISPEYGQDWLNSAFTEDGDFDALSEEELDRLDDAVRSELTALAAPFIEALRDEKNIATYAKFLASK